MKTNWYLFEIKNKKVVSVSFFQDSRIPDFRGRVEDRNGRWYIVNAIDELDAFALASKWLKKRRLAR